MSDNFSDVRTPETTDKPLRSPQFQPFSPIQYDTNHLLDVQYPLTPECSPGQRTKHGHSDSYVIAGGSHDSCKGPSSNESNATFLTPEQSPASSATSPQAPCCSKAIAIKKEKQPEFKVKEESVDCECDFDNKGLVSKGKKGLKVKKPSETLRFPPCLVCGGTSSGYHFGVTTCEACKAFFRRYLLRNFNFKCKKDGKCTIVNRSRGNCSGCRLNKCLAVGMAKEKSKLGRYSVSRRTEAIEIANKLKADEDQEDFKGEPEDVCEEEKAYIETETKIEQDFDPKSEIIGRQLTTCPPEIVVEEFVTENSIENLMTSMEKIYPYGRDIVTDEQIRNSQKSHYERYMLLKKLYGERKAVPKEDFKFLYKNYGIDPDDRIGKLRACLTEIEELMERYCNFAKTIPGFMNLPYRDQSSLLKVFRSDFFTVLCCDGYSAEYNVILYNGNGFHLDEVSGTLFSHSLSEKMKKVYVRWQDLKLTKREKSVLLAIVLTFQDRCSLVRRKEVENIQISLVDLMWRELETTYASMAYKRYSDIINALTLMRDYTEQHLKEYGMTCKDEIVMEEAPMLTEFLLEEH